MLQPNVDEIQLEIKKNSAWCILAANGQVSTRQKKAQTR